MVIYNRQLGRLQSRGRAMSRQIVAQRITSPPTFKSRVDYLSGFGPFCALLEKFSPKAWVTVVLGPGLLSQLEREQAMAEILDRLSRSLELTASEPWMDDLPDGADVIETMQRYAADMAADRLLIAPSIDTVRNSSSGSSNFMNDAGDNWVVRVLLSSMLVSNLYFTFRALDP